MTKTFVRHTDALVDLYVDGEVISTTGEHPFWTPDKGWVDAGDLVVGSLLQTEDGRVIDVDKVEKREGQFEVYNFKVEGFHTYFVSDLGVLVHNANCSFDPRNLQHEYKHAPDFGITGNWDKTNRDAFTQAISNHIDSAPIQTNGTFRNTIPVTHYFDPNTKLWVAVDSNNQFVGGWKLYKSQENDLLSNGNVK